MKMELTFAIIAVIAAVISLSLYFRRAMGWAIVTNGLTFIALGVMFLSQHAAVWLIVLEFGTAAVSLVSGLKQLRKA